MLPLVKLFSKDFYLAGGTAIALQIGHRRSIDFDLFSDKIVYPRKIKERIIKAGYKIDKVLNEEEGQGHYIVQGVKLTFYTYPYEIEAGVKFATIIKMPDLITLAAMKALAISGRGKWKDYVDIYFLMKNYFGVKDILKKTMELFGSVYNDKMFLEQLVYFDDISYEEEVEYLVEEVSRDDIKKYLIERATERI